MRWTDEDLKSICDDLTLAVTSPLFQGICNVLSVCKDTDNITKKLTYINEPTEKLNAIKGFLSKLKMDKFGEKLDEEKCRSILKFLEKEFGERIIGQDELLHMLLVALILNKHALLEGLPGVGKTEIIKWIAYVTGLPFSRVQFIPDMLPSDLIGKDRIIIERLAARGQEQTGNDQQGATEWANGPIFSSLVLADEINRAPSKVQAALLEAMGENQVTPFGKSARPIYNNIHAAALETWMDTYEDKGIFGLPSIPLERKDLAQFTVFATMNPIEQEGTYPLSEAQIDRFCFKIVVPYPDREHYEKISGVMFRQDKPTEAIKGKLHTEKYVEFFRENKNFLTPILVPIYFFLRCRSYIMPVFIGEQVEPNTLYDRLHEQRKNLNNLYDIVLMTNAKTVSTEFSGSMGSYDREQIELRRFIEDIQKNSNNDGEKNRYKKLKELLKLPHCQYVLCGAGPRGKASLEAAALCEAFLKNDEPLESFHIRSVIKSILRHRIHMDVHARLAGVTSIDVINSVCNSILEQD